MIRLSSVSFPPQTPLNADTDTLEETETGRTNKRGVITCDSGKSCCFWFRSGLTFYHPLTRQPVMHDKEKGEPTDLSCFSKRALSLSPVVWYEKEEEVLKATCLSLLSGISAEEVIVCLPFWLLKAGVLTNSLNTSSCQQQTNGSKPLLWKKRMGNMGTISSEVKRNTTT